MKDWGRRAQSSGREEGSGERGWVLSAICCSPPLQCLSPHHYQSVAHARRWDLFSGHLVLPSLQASYLSPSVTPIITIMREAYMQ